ncbi:MAG: hypothetical protein ACPGJR_11795 [Akkermansiaceae bacterium]
MTGAKGRLKTGEILDVNSQGPDVYNTIARTTGVKAKLGRSERPGKLIGRIIA